MRQALDRFIKEHNLFKKDDALLVATSGGADSVALCHLLKDLEVNFSIAHCNFKLRGEESDEDERFVKDLGIKLNVKVFVKHFDTFNEARSEKISIQMVARKLRYDWFQSLIAEENLDLIATGHHKNDNLETVLLNLTRGTGIAGLHGIKVKNNNIIRPLLFATKESIINYLKESRIPYREDSSNSTNKYHRNLIRNKVIPDLKQINPILEETMENFIEKISSIEEILTDEVQKFKAKRVRPQGDGIYLDIKGLENEEGVLIKMYEVLQDYLFSYDQCKSILSILKKQSGKTFHSSGFKAVKDREYLIITKREPSQIFNILINHSDSKISFEGLEITFHKYERQSFQLKRKKNIAQIDYSKLRFPLLLRKWEKGDFFYPLGMHQKKKLSDFFIDQKKSLPEKNKKYVLLSAEEIVWIIGERIDDRYKITADTKEIYEITLAE